MAPLLEKLAIRFCYLGRRISFNAGLIGGTLAEVWYVRRHGISILKMADIVAPSVIIGQTIRRWGDFINQETYDDPVSEAFISYLLAFIKNQM